MQEKHSINTPSTLHNFCHKPLVKLYNFKKEAVEIKILEEMPVTKSEKIIIKRTECSVEPKDTNDKGLIGWILKVEPGKTAEVRFGFSIEYPKEVKLAMSKYIHELMLNQYREESNPNDE
jgi:hypothetical protein